MDFHEQIAQLERLAFSVANGLKAGMGTAAEAIRLEQVCAVLAEGLAQWRLREEDRLRQITSHRKNGGAVRSGPVVVS